MSLVVEFVQNTSCFARRRLERDWVAPEEIQEVGHHWVNFLDCYRLPP